MADDRPRVRLFNEERLGRELAGNRTSTNQGGEPRKFLSFLKALTCIPEISDYKTPQHRDEVAQDDIPDNDDMLARRRVDSASDSSSPSRRRVSQPSGGSQRASSRQTSARESASIVPSA